MKKYGLAVLSGILVALSFSTVLFGWHLPNLGWLAWVGLIPLCLLLFEATPKEAFRFGFVSTAVCNLISTYWLYTALHTFGHLDPALSFFIPLLLMVFMALYIGLAAFLAKTFILKYSGEWVVWLPVFWVVAEWARNYSPFGGFPWTNLAGSQIHYLPFIQIADVAGSYGIIFILVWANVWFAECFLSWQGKKIPRLFPKTVITILLLGLTLGYGVHRLRAIKKDLSSAPYLKMGLIQPNIPQEEKWDEAKIENQKKIFGEAVQSLESHADLIVWPESSFIQAVGLEEQKLPPEAIGLSTHRNKNPYTLLGLDFATIINGQQRFFNSAALLDSDGNILGRYHKTHLVPFGEYIPFEKIFSFLKPVAAIGDFEAGHDLTPLEMGNWKIAPLVCFEDIFPEISRMFAKKGANLFVNITNDAWYGVSSAPYQHLALSVLRAVETRRSLVRATNTGVTAVVNPTGKIEAASPIFERGVLLHLVPLLKEQTIYTKLGDWFVWACVFFVIWNGVKSKIKY